MPIQISLHAGPAISGLLQFLVLILLHTPAAAAEDTLVRARIVAQTERQFSARCAEIGIRDSFLEYFAIDAIHFEPGPRLAHPDLEGESRSTAFRLTWEPKIIRISSSGQLAVSTGPYLLQNKTGKQSFGYFLSIWKQQSAGDISGNLGFTYGTESYAKSSEAYLRVWLWYQSRWWLLFDVATNMK
jgi:hypothetical protein